jgi:hypothetical protein
MVAVGSWRLMLVDPKSNSRSRQLARMTRPGIHWLDRMT